MPATDDPMETDAPAANSTPPSASTTAPAAEAAPSADDMDMTEQTASHTPAPTTSQTPALPIDPDAASYLPECITHTARLLESMFSNHDTCQKFVQQGGVECLLQLYKLPKLPPTFGSSSASHSLLATFRSLTSHSSADIATRLQPALASQFQITLETAKVCLGLFPAEHQVTYYMLNMLYSAAFQHYNTLHCHVKPPGEFCFYVISLLNSE